MKKLILLIVFLSSFVLSFSQNNKQIEVLNNNISDKNIIIKEHNTLVDMYNLLKFEEISIIEKQIVAVDNNDEVLILFTEIELKLNKKKQNYLLTRIDKLITKLKYL